MPRDPLGGTIYHENQAAKSNPENAAKLGCWKSRAVAALSLRKALGLCAGVSIEDLSGVLG